MVLSNQSGAMENVEHKWLKVSSKTYSKCPKCKKGDLDTRVPRGALIKLFLFWTNLKRYRCNSCGAKVYMT